MSCSVCKKEREDFSFRVMKVYNRRVRYDSLNPRVKTLKIQELAGLQTVSVCNECIDKRISDINDPVRSYFKRNIPVVGLAIAGFVAAGVFFNKDKFCAVLGFFCALACIHRAITSIEEKKKKKEAYAKCSVNNARFLTAWELIVESAPRVEADARVSFIPITAATYKMSMEEIKKYYVLTSENAQELYRLINLEKEKKLIGKIEENNRV